MIRIKKVNGIESEYIQCSSCLKCNDNLDIFKLIIGKSMRQTTTVKLCKNCLKTLLGDLRELEVNS